MTTSGATTIDHAETTGARDHDRGRTPAQWYALLVGLTLLLVGLLGFIADASFDTATSGDGDRLGNANGELQGDSFLGFEVNGWHNLVHVASGLFLLAIFRKRKLAKTGVLAFGVLYAVVTLIGLIDGNDIFGLLPVNPADNVLHLVLSAAAILAAVASRGDDHDDVRGGLPADRGRASTTTARRVVAEPRTDAEGRVGTERERLFPQDRNEVR